MADDYFIYTCVSTGLTGILLKPLFIIWVIFLCLGRKRSDHARVGVTYLKAAMPFEVLAMLFYLVSLATYLVYYNTDFYWDYYGGSSLSLLQASTRTSILGAFFERIADILLILTFVEYGNGFLYILTQQRTTLQRILRYAALACGFLIFALAISQFGVLNAAYTSYYNGIGDDDDNFYDGSGYTNYYDQIRAAQRLSAACSILLFVMSLPLFAYAVVVVVKTRHNLAIKNSAVILLVAAILHVIRRIYNLIYVALWVLGNGAPPLAVVILDPIFNIWIFFVVLVLLYVIGVRKAKGLWTTQQAWMGGAPPPALTGQPLPPMSHAWGQYPQQVVFVQQPAPGYMPQGQPPPGWQGQPQMQPQQGAYYYPQGQQPGQQHPTGTHNVQNSELPQGQVANGFHPPQELKT